ncbi:MAG TPA: replication-relaxation family protein, partial [Nitriliruptorales bacterium]
MIHVTSRLTDRDRYLLRMLWEHRVFTTNQVCDLAFDSIDRAKHRLLDLYRLGVLDRFRPRVELGTAPFHYILDRLGAAVVAAERGSSVDELGYRRDKLVNLAHNQRLNHLVGTNGFLTALIAVARRRRSAQLLDWWSERRCYVTWGELVRPDGYGYWRDGDHKTDFFLEYDMGTEPLDRIRTKLDGYHELAKASGRRTPVLFSVPG